MSQAALQQFYIPEEQSVYLLSHHDARKLKDWVALCQAQLVQLGYRDIELIGKGAYGFVFAGSAQQQGQPTHYVFKFSRITLPTHLQERLEEEAFMLDQVSHPLIPGLIAYQRVRGQSILVMERAPGWNLEQVSLRQGGSRRAWWCILPRSWQRFWSPCAGKPAPMPARWCMATSSLPTWCSTPAGKASP